MAKKKSNSKSTKKTSRPNNVNNVKNARQGANYKTEYQNHKRHINQIWSIILFAMGLLLLSIVIIPGTNVWLALHNIMNGIFGVMSFMFPLMLILVGILATMDKIGGEVRNKIWESLVLVAIMCGIIEICFASPAFPIDSALNPIDAISIMFKSGVSFHGGGVLSLLFGWTLQYACGNVGAIIIMFLGLFVFIMLITGATLIGLFDSVSKPVKKMEENYVQKREQKEIEEKNKKNSKFNIDVDLGPKVELPSHPISSPKPDEESIIKFQKQEFAEKSKILKERTEALKKKKNVDNEVIDDLVEKAMQQAVPAKEPTVPVSDEIVNVTDLSKLYTNNNNEVDKYVFPPISLLRMPKGVTNVDVSAELKANADKLVSTLKSFGVETKVIDISKGPTVTRYELQPSVGVKISKITGLADDIALNLAAAGVRIEAPIPNKAAVGIEVPNQKNEVVALREIISSQEFKNAKSKLTISLGKDITGKAVVTDIGKMPHMLIAGTTGSGKSVCINSIIMSIIYKSSPAEVKLMMIDPKVVELGVYNGIPHLLIPVVTDPKKAAGTLAWAVTEMLKRYKIFADNSVRDLDGYNELARTNDEIEMMPQIVIIIDELADLMMAAPNEVEDSICRLAQMARAAGMHLIIATQRPSVDVITGVIKANIPSRIAFFVSSQIDSRTILDTGGAEKLLGKGDMLFFPVGMPKPTRVQGCFVTDKEVEGVVEFIKNKETADYDQNIIEEINKNVIPDKGKGSGNDNADEDSDELLDSAIEYSIDNGQTSTSYLQRRLKVGYARAARLIDEMENKGLVGPFDGSKPRPVLITKQQWYEMKLQKDANKSEN